MSAHHFLRTATAADHEAVDTAFGRFDLCARDGYGGFLLAHARALPAVEAVLAGTSEVLQLRPRTALLHQDLAALGLPTPARLPLAPPSGTAEAYGMAYVIEGSRLGGGMLARRIGSGFSKAYLEDIHLSGEWRAFLRAFDEAADDATWIDSATAAARRVFGLYAAAAMEACRLS